MTVKQVDYFFVSVLGKPAHYIRVKIIPEIWDVIGWLRPTLGKPGFQVQCLLTPTIRDLLFLGLISTETFPQSSLYSILCLHIFLNFFAQEQGSLPEKIILSKENRGWPGERAIFYGEVGKASLRRGCGRWLEAWARELSGHRHGLWSHTAWASIPGPPLPNPAILNRAPNCSMPLFLHP